MSNCAVFHLPELEVEPYQVREVLRCLIHTIILNRAMGNVRPKDVDCELFDITYVHCGVDTVVQDVESKITEFCNATEKRGGGPMQLCLSFFESKARQLAWLPGLGKQQDKLYWEQWYLNLMVFQPELGLQDHSSLAFNNLRAQRKFKIERGLEAAITAIVRHVNEKKDHIPPVVSTSTVTFPFDITLVGSNKPTFGLSTMKRMLLNASPPQMLN